MLGVMSVALLAQFPPRKDGDDVDDAGAGYAGGYGGYVYGDGDCCGDGGCNCKARQVVEGPAARLRFRVRSQGLTLATSAMASMCWAMTTMTKLGWAPEEAKIVLVVRRTISCAVNSREWE